MAGRITTRAWRRRSTSVIFWVRVDRAKAAGKAGETKNHAAGARGAVEIE